MNEDGIKKLHEHCADLAYTLGILWSETDKIGQYDAERIFDWLWLAGSVTEVEVDFVRNDVNFGFCRGPDQYQLNTETIQREFATQLTIFNFAWVSLEALIGGTVTRSQIRRHGKINAACRLIKQRLEDTPALPFYKESLTQLINLILSQPLYRNELRVDLDTSGISGLGVKSVYSIRNTFAHGSLHLPQTVDEFYPPHPQVDTDIITVSIRVVLLTIQMLLMALFHDDRFDLFYWWCPIELKEIIGGDCVEVHKMLRLLHCDIQHWVQEPQEPFYSRIDIEPVNSLITP